MQKDECDKLLKSPFELGKKEAGRNGEFFIKGVYIPMAEYKKLMHQQAKSNSYQVIEGCCIVGGGGGVVAFDGAEGITIAGCKSITIGGVKLKGESDD